MTCCYIVSIELMRRLQRSLKPSTSPSCYFPFLTPSVPFISTASAGLLIVFPNREQTKTKLSIINQQNAEGEGERGEIERQRGWGCSAPSTLWRWRNWVIDSLFQRSSNAHQTRSNTVKPLRKNWRAGNENTKRSGVGHQKQSSSELFDSRLKYTT